jgi:hypothetical protein
LKEFKAVAEKQSDKRIKIIRFDNAKEYVNTHVNNLLKRNVPVISSGLHIQHNKMGLLKEQWNYCWKGKVGAEHG